MAKAWADWMAAKYGKHNARFNQELVDATGRSVSRLRPDVQVYDAKNRRWLIFEVEDTHPVDLKQRRHDMARDLGVPESQIEFRRVPRLSSAGSAPGGRGRNRFP
jgi:hypothetical protein